MPRPPRPLGSPRNVVLIHLALLFAVGLAAYWNTFDTPFQWDEKPLIEENPIVRDLGYFASPSSAKGLPHHGALTRRYVGFLSFALNYRLHGLDVTGYHVVNLSIHLLNAALLYAIVLLSFKTPALRDALLGKTAGRVALFASLLFVAHPVQTEAVTYIFQRLASLAAFFSLLSLAAYLRSRLAAGARGRWGFMALSVLAAVLAMKTKENAFTLPLAIALYEFLFFTGPKGPRALRLVPILLTLIIIPLSLTGHGGHGLASATRGYAAYGRGEYLLTQFPVIVLYLRLLFLPVNQNVDHHFPLYGSFSAPDVAASFGLLCLILAAAVYMLYRSRRLPDLRLAAAGIFWFFLALSVESSVIPLPMLVNEYRLYLPSAGAFWAVSTGAFLLAERIGSKRARGFALLTLALIPLVLASATHARNRVWQSKIRLWEDVAGKSPLNERAHYNLANSYLSEGLMEKAVEHYEIALQLNPEHESSHNNLGIAFQEQGDYQKAIEHFDAAVRLRPDYGDALNNLGTAYQSAGKTEKAIAHYLKALQLQPDSAVVRYNLGISYRKHGNYRKAAEHLEAAVGMAPENAEAHVLLGGIYLEQGLAERAREEFETALRLNPRTSLPYKVRRFLSRLSGKEQEASP